MEKLEFISAEESRARLRTAYRQSGDESFVETLQRPFLNPVEQRNGKGNLSFPTPELEEKRQRRRKK